MKKCFVRSIGALVCVTGAFALSAQDNWWNGTVDDNWSEPGNWSRSRVPLSTDDVYFRVLKAPITIRVSGEQSVRIIYLYEDTSATATGPSVTLKKADGAATAKIVAATSAQHKKGRAIVFDGVAYEQTADDYVLYDYGAITVTNGGSFVMKAASPFFRFRSGSSFVLDSGRASFYPFGSQATDTCTFRVNGGTYDFSSMNGSWVNTFPANAVIDFRGGQILKTTSEVITDARYLPKGTAVFDNQGSSGSGAMAFSASIDEELSGTLYLTNKSNAAVSLSGTEATLWGRGTYFAQWFFPNGNNETCDLDLSRFVLKQYLYGNQSTVRFRNGVEFGAWGGDVSTVNGPKGICLYGDTLFATTDAVDGATSRNITIANGTLTVAPHASLAVTGGGKAAFTATTTVADPIESLAVGAGSALQFGASVNNGKVPVKVDDLTMGDAAKISLTVANASVESVKAPTVGAGAGFEISVSGLTAGSPKTVYYSAAAGADDTLPAVTFSGSAGSWQVKRLEGLLYLEDNASYSELTDETGWRVSPADGYWETAGNWVGGAVPASNQRAIFRASAAAVITNAQDVTITGLTGGLSPADANSWGATTPYLFRGQAMTLSSDTASFTTGALCWWGQAPVIFENEVCGTGANNFYVYVNRPTFAEFRNKLTVAGALNVNGDVRLAGAATAKKLTFGSTAGGRASVLHVYNGGTFALSAQNGVMTDANAILAIAAGSTVSVAGTQFAFNSAATRSHIVDGTLRTTCPYVNLGTQNFAGTGTVAFASATTAADGAGVTTLAHGLTLKMSGDWQTAADATATSQIALDKFERATLGAVADWTYGPKPGVTPTSADSARALTLGDHSELTVAAGSRTITLAEPIAGAKASVTLASGTLKLGVAGQTLDTLTFAGGALAATEAVCTGWTTLLTAKAIVGTPTFGGGVRGRIVANADGTFSIETRAVHGAAVYVK